MRKRTRERGGGLGRIDPARFHATTEAENAAMRTADPDFPADEEIDWSAVEVMEPETATMISIRLPGPTLRWYRERAGARGYQRLMKRVLEVYREQMSKR